MTVLKVIELLGYSNVSWEDAAQKVVTEATRTLKNVRSVYIKDMSAKVENGKITEYRVDGKVTFEIQH